MKGSAMTPDYLSLVVRIWAGHRRRLGRTQKAFGQDTEGNAHTSYSKHCQQGLLGVNKGEPSVDEVAQICQELVVVLGGQITPLKVGVRLLWPVG